MVMVKYIRDSDVGNRLSVVVVVRILFFVVMLMIVSEKNIILSRKLIRF